jgi:isopenicillin-N N-acyltransferase-like protein
MAEPCPLIEISGSPYERGMQYGNQAAARIKRGLQHYGEQLRRLDLDAPATAALIADYLPVIDAFDDTFIPEMRGIARGAGVAFEDVALLNARTEILKLATSPALRAGLRRDPPEGDVEDGCTGIVALPAATRDGRLIHAQNWDWKAECAETAVVLRVRREDGPDILTFTEAGALGRSGLNAAGIAITANYLESDRDYRTIGVPLALIRRKVLMQEHLAMAMRAVYTTRKSGSNNMIVSHAGGVAIDFECAPDETFQVHAVNDVIVHANHWQSPVALGKLRDTSIVNTPDSLYRDLRVRDLLRPAMGAVTIEDVKAALFDDFATPWSVCRPPRLNTANNLSATVAMVVMQPGAGVMEVAMLPALDRRFTRYTLAGAATAQQAAE